MAKLCVKRMLFGVKVLFLFACTSFAAQSPTEITLSTTSQCVTFRNRNTGSNATRTIARDRLPTFSVTTTAGAGLVKTEVLTPQPHTTTEDATLSFYEVVPISQPDLRAYIIYTGTVTSVSTVWRPRTLTTTVTRTISHVATSTEPASAGYTPLQAKHSSVAGRLINQAATDWEVQDEYWDAAKAVYAIDDFFVPGDVPTAVTCFFTKHTASFYSTATLRRSGPRATYTRTQYVDTATWTRTVNVYPTPGNPNATISIDLTTFVTQSSYLGTVTATETTIVHACPSTTTVHAACATDNVINSYNMLGYDDKVHAYAFDALRIAEAGNSSLFDIKDPNATSALDCCAHAALEPNAWFYRYQHQRCNIWIGKDCSAVARDTRPTAELWWAAQPMDDYWRDDNMVVGNGACGGIDVVKPYFYRD